MEIKVLVTRKFFDKDIQYIKSKLCNDCKLIIPNDYSLESLISYSQDIDIFLGSFISKELCLSAPKLKFIQIPWTGVDNLNFDLIRDIGITVCNSHSNSYAVAEHAIALMMDVAKMIAYHDQLLRKGLWNRPLPDMNNPVSPFSRRISGKNVGIIGYGHIGKKIQRLLSGYECKFFIIDSLYNISSQDDAMNYYSIDDTYKVLPLVDFLFISIPLTNSTKGLISKEYFGRMKPNSILINISRGEVINEDDLYFALKNKMIGGAGIDTWYNYPKNPEDVCFPSLKNAFHELDNIVLSPHRSGMIADELPHLDDAIENLNRATKGLPPLNIISITNQF